MPVADASSRLVYIPTIGTMMSPSSSDLSDAYDDDTASDKPGSPALSATGYEEHQQSNLAKASAQPRHPSTATINDTEI